MPTLKAAPVAASGAVALAQRVNFTARMAQGTVDFPGERPIKWGSGKECVKTRLSGKILAVIAIVAVAAATGGWHEALAGAWLRLTVRRKVDHYSSAPLYDGKVHLFFCGTGSSGVNPARAQDCIAIMAGGSLVIFNAGDGSSERAEIAGLPLGDLSGIFLTDLGSNHIGDLGQFAETSWRDGRVTPLTVYGPTGTSQVVAGFDQAYGLSVKFRAAHANEVNLPADNALPSAHEIKVAGAALEPVWQAGGLRVAAFLEDHLPVKPALGYRVTYRDQVVVIAGETRPNQNLERNAHGANVLIVSVYQAAAADRLARAYDQEFGADARPGSRDLSRNLRSLQDFESSMAEAGQEATDADAHMLIVTCPTPDPGSGFASWLLGGWYLHPAKRTFTGPVRLAEDGMRLTLTPNH